MRADRGHRSAQRSRGARDGHRATEGAHWPGQVDERSQAGAHVLAEVGQIQCAEPVVHSVIVGVPVAGLVRRLAGIVVILDRQDRRVSPLPEAEMIGESRAILDDLGVQAEAIHVDHGSEQVGQRVGIIFDAGHVRVQVDGRASLGIPGDHVEVDHAQDVLPGVGHVAGVIVAAPHALLLAGEKDEANGVRQVDVRQQIGRDHQRGGATRVVVGARGRVVGPAFRPGIQVCGEQQDPIGMDQTPLLADDVAQRIAR